MTRAFFNEQHQIARSDKCGICPIINVYAEPYRSQESDDWFHYIATKKDLERIPYKTYIHGDVADGHWDMMHLEKGVWETIIEPSLDLNLTTFPVILYCYNRTYLTIGRGVETFLFPDKINTNFWVFYPDDKTMKEYYLKLKSHNFDSRF